MSAAAERWVSGTIGFQLNGIPMELEVTVPADPVPSQRMLPVFHKLSSALADGAAEAFREQGEPVTCKAGCGACCRQPVPISQAEVYHIAELVEAMPEPRRTQVKRRFDAAAAHFHRIGWYDRFADQIRRAPGITMEEGMPEAMGLVREYFAQGVACPLLENESCSIHPDRPASCREYLVTSPPEYCAQLSSRDVRCIELPMKPSNALQRLGSNGDMKVIGHPLLSRALELAERFPAPTEERTGTEWLQEFFAVALPKAAAVEQPAVANEKA